MSKKRYRVSIDGVISRLPDADSTYVPKAGFDGGFKATLEFLSKDFKAYVDERHPDFDWDTKVEDPGWGRAEGSPEREAFAKAFRELAYMINR